MTAFLSRLALMIVLALLALFCGFQGLLTLVHLHFIHALLWEGVAAGLGIGSVRQALKP